MEEIIMLCRNNRKRITLLLVAVVLTAIASYYLTKGPSGQYSKPPKDVFDRPRYIYSLTGDKEQQLVQPVNVAVSEENQRVYVADAETGSVFVFDMKGGKFLFSFGKKGKGPGRFNYPYGLVLIPRERLWVSDPENATIQEFDMDGNFLRTICSSDYRLKPGLMCIDEFGKVYVSELAFNRLVMFDAKGQYRGEISVEMEHPQGLCFDSEGNLWVVDEASLQLKKIADKKVVKTIQLPGSLPAGLVKGVVRDNLGRLLLTQVLGNRVIALDSSGQALFHFGNSVSYEGGLAYPMGLAVDEDGKIYVADRGNSRVMVWGYGRGFYEHD